jgi:hypothetical protein
MGWEEALNLLRNKKILYAQVSLLVAGLNTFIRLLTSSVLVYSARPLEKDTRKALLVIHLSFPLLTLKQREGNYAQAFQSKAYT